MLNYFVPDNYYGNDDVKGLICVFPACEVDGTSKVYLRGMSAH